MYIATNTHTSNACKRSQQSAYISLYDAIPSKFFFLSIEKNICVDHNIQDITCIQMTSKHLLSIFIFFSCVLWGHKAATINWWHEKKMNGNQYKFRLSHILLLWCTLIFYLLIHKCNIHVHHTKQEHQITPMTSLHLLSILIFSRCVVWCHIAAVINRRHDKSDFSHYDCGFSFISISFHDAPLYFAPYHNSSISVDQNIYEHHCMGMGKTCLL